MPSAMLSPRCVARMRLSKAVVTMAEPPQVVLGNTFTTLLGPLFDEAWLISFNANGTVIDTGHLVSP
jgi:hypothetical protein